MQDYTLQKVQNPMVVLELVTNHFVVAAYLFYASSVTGLSVLFSVTFSFFLPCTTSGSALAFDLLISFALCSWNQVTKDGSK
jgi:hypothetical protein